MDYSKTEYNTMKMVIKYKSIIDIADKGSTKINDVVVNIFDDKLQWATCSPNGLLAPTSLHFPHRWSNRG